MTRTALAWALFYYYPKVEHSFRSNNRIPPKVFGEQIAIFPQLGIHVACYFEHKVGSIYFYSPRKGENGYQGFHFAFLFCFSQ